MTQLMVLPLDKVRPNPGQPRTEFDQEKLELLAGSIREFGLRQPVEVRPNGDGTFELVMGERRWRACHLAGLSEIECVVREVDSDVDLLLLALAENTARVDLNAVEEAKAFQRLSTDGLSAREIGLKTGRTTEHVAGHLEMLGCRDDVLHLVSRRQVPVGLARMIARLTDSGQQRVLRRIAAGAPFEELAILCQEIRGQESQMEIFAETKLDGESHRARQAFGAAVEKALGAVKELQQFDDDDLVDGLSSSVLVAEQQIQALLQEWRRLLRVVRVAKVKFSLGGAEDGSEEVA